MQTNKMMRFIPTTQCERDLMVDVLQMARDVLDAVDDNQSITFDAMADDIRNGGFLEIDAADAASLALVAVDLDGGMKSKEGEYARLRFIEALETLIGPQ